jgi:hypothetical protein
MLFESRLQISCEAGVAPHWVKLTLEQINVEHPRRSHRKHFTPFSEDEALGVSHP